MAFNRAEFDKSFEKSIRSLKNSEAKSKELVRALSRDVLEALHNTGDIGYVNRFIGSVTPMTRKAAIIFYREFSGFQYDDAKGFTSKSKKHYDAAEQASKEFLEDPLNNLWSWSERNIEITPKEFTLEKVTQGVASFLKKAEKNAFSQADVLKAVMAAGFTVDALVEVMHAMGQDVEIKTAKE